MQVNIEKIRKQRRDKDFSQDYMADVLGITQSQYSRIESGRTKLDLAKINLIAKFLEVNPGEIIDFSDSNEHLNISQKRNSNYDEKDFITERELYLVYIKELKEDKDFLKKENLSLKRILEKLMK